MAINLFDCKIYISSRDVKVIYYFNVGHSDPVTLCGKVAAQRIKGTLGITG